MIGLPQYVMNEGTWNVYTIRRIICLKKTSHTFWYSTSEPVDLIAAQLDLFSYINRYSTMYSIHSRNLKHISIIIRFFFAVILTVGTIDLNYLFIYLLLLFFLLLAVTILHVGIHIFFSHRFINFIITVRYSDFFLE